MHKRLLTSSIAVLLLAGACSPASPPALRSIGPMPVGLAGGVRRSNDVVARIIDEGLHRSHVDADLEYMLDVIGPRLTGSDEVKRANDWARQKFVEYKADDSHLEQWTFGIGWQRGPMTLRMLTPQRRELLGASWAWSPGTNGPVAGEVVLVDARNEREFNSRFAGKLSGAWVLVGPPQVVINAADPPVTHADSARVDSLRQAIAPHSDEEREFFAYRGAYIAREHPAGLIRDGGKQFGLFTMSGSPLAVAPVPQIVIANSVYAQLARLAARGEHPRIEVDAHNTFGRDTLQQWNTVAEIRGTEHPDEVVLLGAHLDSWDLATGGTDNGTGAQAVIEAARILGTLGERPKRTIRFVLFTGEEEGLLGSQAYAKAHARELDKFQAVLVLDNGTGRITGMALQGHEETRAIWQQMFQPLSQLGPLEVRSGNKTGTDHLSFIPYGVPSFNYDQLTRGYDHTHHSQIDDYDHTVPGDVMQAATVMAANAWQLADLSQLLPRGKRE
jgi:carboxypeptidase Q